MNPTFSEAWVTAASSNLPTLLSAEERKEINEI
jgi:hypothetical protein